MAIVRSGWPSGIVVEMNGVAEQGASGLLRARRKRWTLAAPQCCGGIPVFVNHRPKSCQVFARDARKQVDHIILGVAGWYEVLVGFENVDHGGRSLPRKWSAASSTRFKLTRRGWSWGEAWKAGRLRGSAVMVWGGSGVHAQRLLSAVFDGRDGGRREETTHGHRALERTSGESGPIDAGAIG